MNYLYNGVELPALPERDRETYPYAQIMYYPNNEEISRYVLTCYNCEPSYYSSNNSGFKLLAEYPWKALVYRSNGSTAWDQNPPVAYERQLYDWGYTNYILLNLTNSNTLIWANIDYLIGSSVYLEASDPIPVNPAPTLDPTSLLMGWQVGNRIRQRK